MTVSWLELIAKELPRKKKSKSDLKKVHERQIISDYTRSTQTTNTVIDWIYTDSQYIADSGTLNINLSDHLPIFLIRKKQRNRIEKHTTSGRSYIRYDKTIFCQILSRQDWTSFDESEDVDEMWKYFEGNLNKSLDVICPVRTINVLNTKPDWLSNEIIQLMRKRDKAYKKARRTKHDVDWRKAIFLRNRVDMFIKQYKKHNIVRNLEMHKNNPNKFWKEIRSIIPKEQQAEVISLSDEASGCTYEGKELCDHINLYFSQIGEKLANSIKMRYGNQQSTHFIPTVLNIDSDSISNVDFNVEELQKVLKGIDQTKSSAIPNI